jgi:glycosyltransferase involved in cell wall biosynthesis
MLPFEPKEMARYGLSKGRVRLEVLKHIHSRTLRKSRLAIFLTDYAHRTITASAGPMRRSQVIPHGIDDSFRALSTMRKRLDGRPVRCLYVSDAAPYKHNWNVVDAIADLRERGLDMEIVLVGGGSGASRRRLDDAVRRRDPGRRFVRQVEAVTNEEVREHLTLADLFIFASSCENMPITVLEAMAAGVPICSSDRGPMPEILGQSAYYFDPENVGSIAASVELALSNDAERLRRARLSLELSRSFSWEISANKTWSSLASVCG